MKVRIALLTIVFATSLLAGHAEEPPPPAMAHRLEYIRFNPAAQTIEWGVSEGTLTGGEFVPKPIAVASYSIHLITGVKERDGEARPMSPSQSKDAARVFQALALLMQTYTDRWDEPALADQPPSDEDGSQVRIVRIAAQAPVGPVSNSARPGHPLKAIAELDEAFLPQTSFPLGAFCVGRPVYTGMHLTALAQPQ